MIKEGILSFLFNLFAPQKKLRPSILTSLIDSFVFETPSKYFLVFCPKMGSYYQGSARVKSERDRAARSRCFKMAARLPCIWRKEQHFTLFCGRFEITYLLDSEDADLKSSLKCHISLLHTLVI